MASTTFLRDTGCKDILHLLLLGVLLPSVLASSETAVPSSSGSASPTGIPANTTTNSTQPLNTTGSTATAPSIQPATTNSGSNITGPTTNSTTVGTSTTFGGKPSASSTVTMMQSSTAKATGGTSSTFSMTSNSSMTSLMSTSLSSNSSGSMNGTTMIQCPSFTCNYSDCYTMYNSQNATRCAAGDFCQLIRQMDMCYTVSCSASCANSCVNTSQTNCSMSCCNSTGCLNSSFASMMMMMTTTVIATTTTTPTPATTMTATSPQTTENNGKKCRSGVCIGTDCYTKFQEVQICSASQPHCQLKKETKDSSFQWTAGCTNCSGQTPCKTSTVPPCLLECCNATTSASCLMLNGMLNVPNFATRGPHLHKEWIASLICLLAITLLQ
ncbi:mucin-5AC [Etheostoma spectabile]|uniref:mucin-5AC n=1 Tax=Etheostoma spectabile TaxID=54343 RepID=UPI0013AEA634|nr:mucin-5AC-like [Etheostoma spectabile]